MLYKYMNVSALDITNYLFIFFSNCVALKVLLDIIYQNLVIHILLFCDNLFFISLVTCF